MASSGLQSGKVTDTIVFIAQIEHQPAGLYQFKHLLPQYAVGLSQKFNWAAKSLERFTEERSIGRHSR